MYVIVIYTCYVMRVTEENGYREYVDDVGKRYRSVTGILSATKPDKDKLSIQNWRRKKGEREADLVFSNACLRGTATHEAAESFLKGEDVVITYEPAIPYWESLRKGLVPISDVVAMEEAISHKLGFGGRFDCLATYKGVENSLIDFKTSDKIKMSSYLMDYRLQLAAYSGGIYQTLGHRINQGILIIGIPYRNPQIVILSRDELLIYWKLWERRVHQYHEMQAKMYLDNLSEVA